MGPLAINRAGFLCCLLVAVQVSRQRPADQPRQADKVLQQHVDNGAALEKIGLNKEAESEYLAALAATGPAARQQIVDALERVRKAERNAIASEADVRSDGQLQLGTEFQTRGQYDQALTAFQNAYNEAGTDEARARARAALRSVLSTKRAFWQQYIREWLEPVGAKTLLLFFAAYLLYWAVRFIGRVRARFSNSIEISEFDDATGTGFGKAFPHILRTAYENVSRSSSVRLRPILSAYRRPADLPIMVPSRYQNLPEIGLNVAGVEASKLIGSLPRLLQQAHFTVRGAVYRSGEEIRVTSAVAQYNGAELRSDSALWRGPGSAPAPHSAAYDIIALILSHWDAETR